MKIIASSLLAIGMLLGADMKSGDADAVRQAERAWAQAALKGDVAALGQVLSDDLTYTHGSGRPENKAQYLEAIRSGAQKYEALDYDDVTVRVYGNTAVVNSELHIRTVSSGQLSSSHSRFLHVYVKQGNVWRMVAHQSTRIT